MYLRKKTNLLPLAVFLGSIGVIIAGFFVISIFFAGGEGVQKKAHLDSSDSSIKAEVKLSGEERWNEVTNVYVHEGDTVRSKGKGGVKIDFLNETVLVLDQNTTVKLVSMREYDDQSMIINVELEEGHMWTLVQRKINPNSKVIVKSTKNNLTATTANADFSFADNQAVVVRGDMVAISVPAADNPKETIFSATLGVGQMIIVNGNDFANVAPQMVSDEFRDSAWYALYKGLDAQAAKKIAVENSPDAETLVPTETDVATTENSALFAITAPNDGRDGEMTKTDFVIEGTADESVAKIVIDDYELSKYRTGDGKWSYKVGKTFGNGGKPGETKTYEAEAYNDAGDLIATDNISITFLTPEATAETAEEEETAAVNGDLKITAPTAEADYETAAAEIILSGSAPAEAAKITVSGYALSAFRTGNATWSYKIREDFGNRGKAGESVVYTIKAYDKDDKLIGSDQITIKFTATETAAPSASTEASPATATEGSASDPTPTAVPAEETGTGAPAAEATTPPAETAPAPSATDNSTVPVVPESTPPVTN